MECKRLIFLSAIFLTMNLFTGKIYAQEIEPEEIKNYYMTRDENNNIKFIQRLSWNKIDTVEYFKVTIQKLVDGEYENILEKDQKENFIEVSFEPGKYRFQVGAVDVFDKIPKKSDWKEFEIRQVIQPQIDKVAPTTINKNSKNEDGILTVTGKNLLPQTQFKIQLDEEDFENVTFWGQVLEADDEHAKVQVQFDLSELIKGSYEFFALNPGGLSDSYKSITVKEKKSSKTKENSASAHFQFAGGYAPLFVPFGGPLEEFADKKFILFGAKAKISVLGEFQKKNYFGAGLSANYTQLESETDLYKFNGDCITAMANLIYQKFFSKEIIKFDLHAGAGISMLHNLQFVYNKDFLGVEYESPTENFFGLAFNGGFALQFYPGRKKHFFFEIGGDFIFSKFSDMNFMQVVPSASIGGTF